jgi:activating signal cointegrator 1
MKCLSVLQPWASLILLGAKKIETRSWATKYRGLLLIHAGKGWNKAVEGMCALEPFQSALAAHKEPLPRGCIIGQVELCDCIPIEDAKRYVQASPPEAMGGFSEHELAFGDYTPGRWAWLLTAPQVVSLPMPYKGSLGIFNVKDELWKGA